MVRCTSVNYPQMWGSLRVVCQQFLIDSDRADRGRRRSCHLWDSLSLASLALVLVLLPFLLSSCLSIFHPLWHLVGWFEPAWTSVLVCTVRADRCRWGLAGG